MATKIEVPIALRDIEVKDAESADAPESGLDVRFPEYCVYCGAPAEAHGSVSLTYKPEQGAEDKKESLSIPYCAQHEKVNKRISTVDSVIYLSLGVLALITAIFGTVEIRKVQEEICLQVSFCGFGFLLYLLAGILVGVVIRTIVSVFSKPFRHTPLFGGSLGFGPKYKKEENVLYFSFTNDDYAVKFMELNSQATQKHHYEEDPTAFHWIINGTRRNRYVLELALWVVPMFIISLIILIHSILSPEETDTIAAVVIPVLFGPLVALGSILVIPWRKYSATQKLIYSVVSLGVLPVLVLVGDIFRAFIVKPFYIGEEPLRFGIIKR
jgi:hypothetical protein